MFRAHLAETLYNIGFRSSKADPDVWLRPVVKPNSQTYYEYILCYVDDILSVSLNATSILKSIQVNFKHKDDKIEPPSDYLGAVLGQINIDGKTGWYLSSEKFVKSAVENVEQILQKGGQKLPSKCKTPLSSSYQPELDTSPELKEGGLQCYQELIGVLRWSVELGRVDILLETSMMSTHLALPRCGHLEQLYHMFGYFKANPKRKLYLDPQHPQVDERLFQSYDWYDFYRDTEEAVPGGMPPPRGESVSMHCFVDSDHAGNTVTRRSQTGLLLFVNRAPIVWYSKHQNTVKTSTFGSEFIPMKTAVEQIEALRYKPRVFGVPLEGPTNIFCDNESVFKNSSIPDSTLKKKNTSICYHRSREEVAVGMVRFAKEGTTTNLSDLFTKPLPEPRCMFLFYQFTY